MKSVFVALLLSLSASVLAIDLDQVGKDLQGAGVVGWIHGSVAGQQLYVFTVRNPTNFFDYAELSLTSSDPAVQKQLATLNRQDQVRVKGAYLDLPPSVPQKHIDASSIEMVQAYNSGYPADPYQHEAQIPADLMNQNVATFLVHAVAGGGQIMVLEYKDAVVPMFVKTGALTKNLFRGDVVQIHYKIQHDPHSPTHLDLDETATPPVSVTQSIQSLNGKKVTLQGALVLFPKSPEINFNVFAVQELLQAGLQRQYTLVNFDDPAVFQKIRDTLQAAWDRHGQNYVNGRNKLVSSQIQVKVTGTINETDPSQANPQILLPSVDAIQIIESH